MNNVKAIRDRLGLTQAALAQGLGCTQGNVWHYEQGQTIPPDAAKRLIDYAATLGHAINFNDIYGEDVVNVPVATDASELVKHAGDPLTQDPVLNIELVKAEQSGLIKLPKQEKPEKPPEPAKTWDGVTERRTGKQRRSGIERRALAEKAGKGSV